MVVDTNSYKNSNQALEGWTTDYAMRKLKLELATFEVDGSRKYYEQAKYLQYRIAVYKPVPIFTVYLSDLSQRMVDELRSLDPKTLEYVLKQAVGRLFEDLNAEYYHNSVSSMLRVRLKRCQKTTT
jgi:hypothetical protein